MLNSSCASNISLHLVHHHSRVLIHTLALAPLMATPPLAHLCAPFRPFVISLFLETYQQVDQATRSKMEEMLLT